MWFDRIYRQNNEYFVVDVSANGKNNFIDIATAYKKKQNIEENIHLRVATNFTSWQRASANQYADGYSIPKNATIHHIVYRFISNLITIFVPSWVLQCDLFSPPSVIFKYLYCVNGFERLCHPELLNDKYVACLHAKAKHFILRSSKCGMNRINWFFAFPSAYRAWISVYKFARQGKIGIDLPEADITCLIHGKQVGNVIFARRIRILTLRPKETPTEWAQSDQNEIRFDASGLREVQARRLTDFDLSRQNGTSSLSDIEWGLIEPIATKSSRRDPMQQRLVIDAILEKLTEGKPWSAVNRPGVAVLEAYYSMVRNGRWREIRTILLRRRNTAERSSRNNDNMDICPIATGRQVQRFLARTKDPELLPRYWSWNWGTSDVEWKAIKVIVTGTNGNSQYMCHRARLVIDSIIEKLGTGKTWSDIVTSRGVSRTTLLGAYQKLNADGRWAQIRSVLGNTRAKTTIVDFPPRAKGWQLSEAEWKTIQPIVNRCDVSRSSLHRRARLLVDCIVEKLGRGTSWADVGRSNGICPTVLSKTLARLKSDGRWQDICSVLRNTRGLADRTVTKGK
ncbi:hypothetical protein [Paraburkholderia youngii]|uniref:Uncharacterized protein n=1 Tax=Paraburkholderia youngii TaxID=2782701 RepID=A0A7Y6MYK6_9BURK|nr:hypothetical protein [Paraburkholderia youngii]NUX99539.1 hypothetical protein [Paraburkholderia youngii]